MYNFFFEKQFSNPVVGIDEAGRGPLAGPVVTCALFLKEFQEKDYHQLINDSKKLSEKKRDQIYDFLINDPNISYKTAIADSSLIDKINILEATKSAMSDAYEGLSIEAGKILIDGNHKMARHHDISMPVIKGDSKVFSIAAASIIAKVTRDKMMLEYDKQYPEYGFAKHMGYGTKFHLEALKKHGPCPIHRMSFAPIKKIAS